MDTAGWMACADRTDPAHLACCTVRDAALDAGRTLITTAFIVDETLTLIRFQLGLGSDFRCCPRTVAPSPPSRA